MIGDIVFYYLTAADRITGGVVCDANESVVAEAYDDPADVMDALANKHDGLNDIEYIPAVVVREYPGGVVDLRLIGLCTQNVPLRLGVVGGTDPGEWSVRS